MKKKKVPVKMWLIFVLGTISCSSVVSAQQFLYGADPSSVSGASSSGPHSRDPVGTTDNVYRQAGENVTLLCQGLTEDSLVRSVKWICQGCYSNSPSHETVVAEFKEGQDQGDQDDPTLMRPEDSLELSSKSSAPPRVTLTQSVFSIEISPLAAEDSGEYMCLVNNRKRPNVAIRLFVQDVPAPPGVPLVMGFTSRSVNLSWTPPFNTHNSPISHYLIHVRVGENGIWDETNTLETQSNATVFQVDDLQPFTTYSFRITALNALGRSHPSKESYYMITLREVPSGKPTITAAHNTSSSSIQLSWRPPHPSTLHGEFLGYRIAYKPRHMGPEAVNEMLIKDPNVDKYTITRLRTFTQYLISIQVYNPEGLGPSTTVVVMTDEGVPSQPMNVSFRGVTNASVLVRWHQPKFPNGIIQGYRLYYMHKNYTDVQTIRDPEEEMEHNLEGLEPFTKYKLWLKAFTWKNEGEPSEPFEMLTDVDGPSAPLISNLTCKDEQSIYLEWERPERVYKGIDFYFIYYRSEDEWQFEEIIVERNGSQPNDGQDSGGLSEDGSKILLSNLTTNAMHELKVRAATRSIYNETTIYRGDFSEPQKILLKLNCDQVKASTVVRTATIGLELSAGIIAGGTCVLFALLLALVAIALWRRYFNESYYYLDESPATPAPSVVPDWDIEQSVTTSMVGEGGPRLATTRTAIPAHLFIQHVASLHANEDIGFSKEYEAIQSLSTHEEIPADSSYQADNKLKNRYHNVVAYDHSRVQLRPLPGQKRGEYVNANYIDGFQKAHAYIGTQGPLPSTFDSFWRMIWEQKVKVVVMITNLVERGRRKCDLYWPTEGQATYGLIEVSLVSEEELATYTVRTFKIRHIKIKAVKQKASERFVHQYHYTNWPDHGVPENPLPVLSFVKKSSASSTRESDGPIVVHCSAGVGRTGAYILIDAMLKQMRAKGELNLVAYLKHIRTQRNYLVQTEEQFMFVHDALAEAVASGETNINRSYLSRYISSLQSSFTTDENSIPWQLLDRQFKLATAYQPQEVQFMAALKSCNQCKNQNFDYLPIESARVPLAPRVSLDGSDYINASWLPGFKRLKEFIITQHPTDHTVDDFWQMLWDHNVRSVVVLSALQQPEFGIFWPSQQVDLDLDAIRVKLVDESEYHGYQTKEFNLISHHDDYEMSVKLLFCPSWPHHCSPLSTASDLIRVANTLHTQVQHSSGPLAIVDRFGGPEAATFCALSTLLRQLDFENHVDVYQYAKVAHNRRPGIWKSQDDYLFLYRVIESVCSNGPVSASTSSTSTSSCGGSTIAESSSSSTEGLSVAKRHCAKSTFSSGKLSTSGGPHQTRLTAAVVPHINGHSNSRANGGTSSMSTVSSSTSSFSIRVPPDGMESASHEGLQKA